jgi:hypothetical protein
MNRTTREFLEIPPSSYADLLPIPTTKEQCNGAYGISYLFIMGSQTLTLATGVVAIVSLKEFGPAGAWHHSELSTQVSTLATLAFGVTLAVERTLGYALSNLENPSRSAQSPAEVSGIKEIRSIGNVYVTLLKNVAAETWSSAIRQNLSMASQRLGGATGAPIPGTQAVEDSIRRLTDQVRELGLRIEMFEEKIT